MSRAGSWPIVGGVHGYNHLVLKRRLHCCPEPLALLRTQSSQLIRLTPTAAASRGTARMLRLLVHAADCIHCCCCWP